MINNSDIKIVKSWNYKRLSMSVAVNGTVRVSAPKFVSNKRIDQFIKEYGKKLLVDRQNRYLLKSEDIKEEHKILLPFNGSKLAINTIFNSTSRSSLISSDSSSMTVRIAEHQFDDRLNQWQSSVREFYRKNARIYFTEKADQYAKEMNVRYNRIRIGDQTSRWGSCSSKKTLSFNLRLLMAPVSVSEYVAVHEVAHLIEQNHSKKFWQVVETFFPDYLKARKWLRMSGNDLWKYF